MPSPSPRIQFPLSKLFAATFACALVFAVFRWLGLTPQASLFISFVAICCLATAGVLMAVIVKSLSEDERGD